MYGWHLGLGNHDHMNYIAKQNFEVLQNNQEQVGYDVGCKFNFLMPARGFTKVLFGTTNMVAVRCGWRKKIAQMT